jgi:hypothetical protein
MSGISATSTDAAGIGTTGMGPIGPAVSEVVPARSHLRLTRRGRVVFTTLAAVPLAIVAVLLGMNGGIAIATNSSAPDLDTITVQAGQSLWSVAESIAPGHDPRDVIHELSALNGLESASVDPGQVLAVPGRYADQ